ncbi:MAG: hypothetical protein LBB55_03490 [Zoogloeaceae bacterium]|jgi:hypothetical protein|nr:hypothetical protein [Zoogloeaceae bacterium]
MKNLNKVAAGSLVLLACLAFSGAWAQEAQEDFYTNKSSGPVVLLPPPYVGDGGDGMPAGTLHFPGREYRSGDGWWTGLFITRLSRKYRDQEKVWNNLLCLPKPWLLRKNEFVYLK